MSKFKLDQSLELLTSHLEKFKAEVIGFRTEIIHSYLSEPKTIKENIYLYLELKTIIPCLDAIISKNQLNSSEEELFLDLEKFLRERWEDICRNNPNLCYPHADHYL